MKTLATTEKYTPKWAVDLDEATHTYFVANKVVPGFHSVIDFLGLRFDYGADTFYRDFGRAAHEATSLYDLGVLNTDTLDPRLLPALNQYKDFLETTGFKVRANEIALYSPRGYCTRIDRGGILNGRFALIEIKFGTSVDDMVEYQLCAQQLAWEDNFIFEPIVVKYVLHIKRLDKDITPDTRWKWSLITKWTDSRKTKFESMMDWYKLKLKRGPKR